MTRREQIFTERNEAMKTKNTAKLDILRVLSAQIKNQEIDLKAELNDEQVEEAVRRQVKQLTDALHDFESAGRSDLAEQAKSEVAILSEYLPAQLDDAELVTVVDQVLALESAPYNVGKIIGAVMKEVKGKADGNRVKEIVNRKLNS